MIPRVFLDTNVVLDLLGERQPFYISAARLATLADKGEVRIVVSPISFSTLHYLLTKYENSGIAREKLRKFKILCEICSLDEIIIEKGLDSSFPDFEDALQYFSAVNADCGVIITRNGKDFKNSLLPVMTAEEFLISFQNRKLL